MEKSIAELFKEGKRIIIFGKEEDRNLIFHDEPLQIFLDNSGIVYAKSMEIIQNIDNGFNVILKNDNTIVGYFQFNNRDDFQIKVEYPTRRNLDVTIFSDLIEEYYNHRISKKL